MILTDFVYGLVKLIPFFVPAKTHLVSRKELHKVNLSQIEGQITDERSVGRFGR